MKKDSFFIAIGILALVYVTVYEGSEFVFGQFYTLHWFRSTRLLPICIGVLVTLSVTSILARYKEALWISVAFWLHCLTSGAVLAVVGGGRTWGDARILPYYYLIISVGQVIALVAMLYVRGKPIRPYFLSLFAASLCHSLGYWAWLISWHERLYSFPYYFVYLLEILPFVVYLLLFLKVARLPRDEEVQKEIDSIGAT